MMRARLLSGAEVLGWIAVSFTVFLGLRVGSIFLNLVNPAQCNESCGAGGQVIPLALMTFGLGWFPMVLVHFVRVARGSAERWFVVHTVVVVAAHVVAMVIVIRIFAEYGDADTRSSILAGGAAFFDVLTGVLLLGGTLLRPRAEGEQEAGTS
ncbi:MAG: hypothetical protein NVSMB17_02340 [Candidatus Dormibacteria bacterium]